MQEFYTEDISKFGSRERSMLTDLLNAWDKNGLPDDFYDDGVKPAFNMNSGNVFLVNSDYQVCMECDGQLESFYSTPYEGREGFFEDLMEEYDDMHIEDQRFMDQIKQARGE